MASKFKTKPVSKIISFTIGDWDKNVTGRVDGLVALEKGTNPLHITIHRILEIIQNDKSVARLECEVIMNIIKEGRQDLSVQEAGIVVMVGMDRAIGLLQEEFKKKTGVMPGIPRTTIQEATQIVIRDLEIQAGKN